MKKFLVTIMSMFISLNIVHGAAIDNIKELNGEMDSLLARIEYLYNNSINYFYPVGSIYMSVNSTNPSQTVGGVWASYGQGRKLIGAGSNGVTNYTNGSTGGSSTKKLSTSNISSHSHTITPSGTVTSSFSGTSVNTNTTGSHSHTLPMKDAASEVKGYGLLSRAMGGNAYFDRVMVKTSTGNRKHVNSGGEHTHSMTASGTVTSSFSGSSATTSSSGNSESFSIQNPYVVVYIWKRTA